MRSSKLHGLRHYLYIGLHLGYPLCCILEFSKLKHVGGPPRKLHGTGFIPCARCDKERSAKEIVRFINAHRLIETPFPTNPSRVFQELDNL